VFVRYPKLRVLCALASGGVSPWPLLKREEADEDNLELHLGSLRWRKHADGRGHKWLNASPLTKETLLLRPRAAGRKGESSVGHSIAIDGTSGSDGRQE
jgi:hypothetical protein